MTIAEQLDGKLLESFKGNTHYDLQTRIYTFDDGSKAIALSRFKDIEPFMSGTTTMSKIEVMYWMKKSD